jgi:hypothetical protein
MLIEDNILIINMNQASNIFDEINQKVNTKPIKDLDSKWQQRNEGLKVTTTIEDVHTRLMVVEESLRKNERERLFHQRRIQKIVKPDTVINLKDKLTVSMKLYEHSQEIKPQV